MQIRYSLLENGLDFILDAIRQIQATKNNDTTDSEKKKHVKYALLHLSSGIELIFKFYLFKENWVYIFSDMNKASLQKLNSGDFTSVDHKGCIDRLENICEIKLNQDQKNTLDKLRKLRNTAEHFELNHPLVEIEKVIRESLSIVVDFLSKNYDINEFKDQEKTYYDDIKNTLRTMERHYKELKIMAQNELDNLENILIQTTCPFCGEPYLAHYTDKTDNQEYAKCTFCNFQTLFTNLLDEYLNFYDLSPYLIMKNGGELPVYPCPFCSRESFVINPDKNFAMCLSCLEKYDSSEIQFCSICNEPFVSKDRITICKRCLNSLCQKDD